MSRSNAHRQRVRDAQREKIGDVICQYCDTPSERVDGDVIYPHRPDLAHKTFYLCIGCDAYVGCHPGTEKPLGVLANEELRKAKSAAHRAFDPLWKGGRMSRKSAYAWLAGALQIDPEKCHIGMFDVATCERTIELCRERRS